LFRAKCRLQALLRIPLIINLRRDPYEREMQTSNAYLDWLIDRAFLLVPAQAYVGMFLQSFQEYPPRMKAASFSLDQVIEKLAASGGSKLRSASLSDEPEHPRRSRDRRIELGSATVGRAPSFLVDACVHVIENRICI
jgi:hypothetical protein